MIPIGDQSIADQMYLPRQNQASGATRKLLEAAKVTYAEATSKFMIHLVLHEMGHLQVRRYGIEPPNYWLTEFLCNYLSYAYLKTEKPRLALVVEALNLVPTARQPHTSLEDFETLSRDPKIPTGPTNIGFDNYGWYQQQFERRAISAYGTCGGVSFLTRVKTAFPSGASGAIAKPKAAPAEALARLERLCPGFEAWASTLNPRLF